MISPRLAVSHDSLLMTNLDLYADVDVSCPARIELRPIASLQQLVLMGLALVIVGYMVSNVFISWMLDSRQSTFISREDFDSSVEFGKLL